ncbi:MAG: HD domain-containing protein [Fibromonadaceae bacterium]|jgi:HD-GYP domain-containing protein (c-di-GMP phosphodiesterase class II)|nr:HD domain-containing protein [Fibromonadaceae bacterium]
MLYSIMTFLKSLANFKVQANEQKIFADWIYTICMILMVFFFVCYIAVDIIFLVADTVSMTNLLIAFVFVFGAVFVYTMITMLKRMSTTISKKTNEIIKALVNAMEAKDEYTQGHSIHVANVTKLIYKYLPERIKNKIHKTRLIDAAVLHDIGKIGIPDNVLNKPGTLTPEERLMIEQHPMLGKKILEPTSYQLIGEIVYYHHERMDGKGYFNIPPEKIPLESRIIAIADTFSALCTDRIYRPKKSYEEAVQIIKDVAGTQLDAEIVKVFCTIPKKEFENLVRFV